MVPLAAMQKINLVLLGVLLLGILGTSFASVGTKQSEAPTGQNSCPPAHQTAWVVMEEFLTDPSWAEERQEVGATGFAADDIRRLSDPEDTNLCQKLQKDLGGNEEEIANVFYQVGSFFFIIGVPAHKSTPEDLNLYGESVVVFKTTSLNPKGTFIR